MTAKDGQVLGAFIVREHGGCSLRHSTEHEMHDRFMDEGGWVIFGYPASPLSQKAGDWPWKHDATWDADRWLEYSGT